MNRRFRALRLNKRPTQTKSSLFLVPKLRLGRTEMTLRVIRLLYNAERCRKAFPNGVWEREKRHSQTEFGNEKYIIPSPIHGHITRFLIDALNNSICFT